jgi:hypothetical protein
MDSHFSLISQALKIPFLLSAAFLRNTTLFCSLLESLLHFFGLHKLSSGHEQFRQTLRQARMTTYQERRAAMENASGSKDTLGRNCYEHRHPESKAPTSITHQNNELILRDRSLNIVKPYQYSINDVKGNYWNSEFEFS